jgi:uncharacterized protein (DUF58 family)
MARIETDFPFGLVCKSRVQPCPVSFQVWPRIHPVRINRASSSNQEEQQPATRLSPSGVEFFGIREYRPGDPPQRIHWKHTARLGRTIVREFERPRTPEMKINCQIPSLDDADVEDRFAEVAASLVVAGLASGFRVALRTPTVNLPPGLGAAHQQRILDALSLEEPLGSAAVGGVWLESFDASGRPIEVDVDFEEGLRWDPASGTVSSW